MIKEVIRNNISKGIHLSLSLVVMLAQRRVWQHPLAAIHTQSHLQACQLFRSSGLCQVGMLFQEAKLMKTLSAEIIIMIFLST